MTAAARRRRVPLVVVSEHRAVPLGWRAPPLHRRRRQEGGAPPRVTQLERRACRELLRVAPTRSSWPAHVPQGMWSAPPHCPVPSWHSLSWPVLTCPSLSRPALPCPVLSCPDLTCNVMPCPVQSRPTLPYPVLPCPALFCSASPCRMLPCLDSLITLLAVVPSPIAPRQPLPSDFAQGRLRLTLHFLSARLTALVAELHEVNLGII